MQTCYRNRSRTNWPAALAVVLAIATLSLGQEPQKPADDHPKASDKPQTAPAEAPRPTIESAQSQEEPALGGHCPVSYHSDGKAVKGSRDHRVEYQGFVYYLADAEKKKSFEQDPDKYLPRIGGLCTVALGGPYGNRFRGDPTVFAVVDGKLYFCSSPRAKRSFDRDPSHYINRAEELFLTPELNGVCPVTYQTAGASARGHVNFRQVYRAKVYHLKNDEALAEFKKDPERYVPQFDGYCTEGVSQGKAIPVDPSVFAVMDGRTYLFSTGEARARCFASSNTCITAAKEKWPEVKKTAGKAPGT